MPGEPELQTDQDDLMRSIDAHLDYQSTLLGVTWQQWKAVEPAERLFAFFHEGMRLGGMPATDEKSLVTNGFPGREFIRRSADLNYVHRYVVMADQTIAVSAIGGADLHDSEVVRRFL